MEVPAIVMARARESVVGATRGARGIETAGVRVIVEGLMEVTGFAEEEYGGAAEVASMNAVEDSVTTDELMRPEVGLSSVVELVEV